MQAPLMPMRQQLDYPDPGGWQIEIDQTGAASTLTGTPVNQAIPDSASTSAGSLEVSNPRRTGPAPWGPIGGLTGPASLPIAFGASR
jgi:hypothetical protein